LGPALFGPTGALAAGDALSFGGLALALALALRATAIRFRAALAIEGAVVVAAVAATVAAHRNGMIARPLEISDWFWTRGIDPVMAFLGVGLVGAILLMGVLAYGRARGRSLAQLLVVLLIGVAVAGFLHGRDPSARRDVLGEQQQKDEELKKRQDEARAQQQRQQQGGGQANPQTPPQPDPMPRGGGSENRPSAVVVFHKGVVPSAGAFYFRHASFSQYNGNRLIETTVPGIDLDARRPFPVRKEPVPGVKHHDAVRTEVAHDVALLVDHPRMFLLTDAVEVEPLPNPDPARFRRAYRAVSSVITAPYDDLIGRMPGDPEWGEAEWSHYTELPRDERYHRLAAELTANLRAEYQGDPIASAMAIKRYLEENFTYSFARRYEGDDPTGDFLFGEDKRGYCVHLAHSAAYLLRAAGVPARVSAGYAVPTPNLGGGSALLIKNSDAHAWAELYLAGVGWVPIEVTPEKSDVEPTPFNERDLQTLLGEMARKEGRAEREMTARVDLWRILKQALALMPWLMVGLVALAYGIKGWRLLVPHLAARRHQPLVAYRAALDRLASVGVVRRRGESRERFAARVGPLSESFSRLTAVHVGVALGSSQHRGRGEPLPRLAIGVGGELRRQLGWWRWALGLLNPLSWIRSR
jgi:hypothetical protein